MALNLVGVNVLARFNLKYSLYFQQKEIKKENRMRKKKTELKREIEEQSEEIKTTHTHTKTMSIKLCMRNFDRPPKGCANFLFHIHFNLAHFFFSKKKKKKNIAMKKLNKKMTTELIG